MGTRQIQASFLRLEDVILVNDRRSIANADLETLTAEGFLQAVKISTEFRDFCRQNLTNPRRQKIDVWLNVSTVTGKISDDWLEAFRYWSGVPVRLFLLAIVLQGNGKEGPLLTNGVLNGCVLRESSDWAAVARWHDPERLHHKDSQMAVWPEKGWSLDIVSISSRAWCKQGMRILYL